MSAAVGLVVRPATSDDRAVVDAFLAANHSDVVARLDEVVDARAQEALLAERDGVLAGVATLLQHGDAMELLSLHVVDAWQGTGTALLAEAARVARERGCRRLWLVTTNDNLDALRFYQRRGLHLAELRPGAVEVSRATRKPSIPVTGDHGIPIRDELVLELVLR